MGLLSGVRRPSVAQLSLNLTHGFLSNFGCFFPWGIRSGVFAITFFIFTSVKEVMFLLRLVEP